MSELCERIHHAVHSLDKHRFPYGAAELPTDGVYFLFEEGETAHGGERVVRVGSHRGDGQLPGRLEEHFMNENKDRSIFRKNVGRALLNREDDPFLEDWNLDLTSREMRERHEERIDFAKQDCVEDRVTNRIQQDFSFSVISVDSRERRRQLEKQVIAAVSLCNQCGPSDEWLGRWSTKKKIRESGLWQEHHVNNRDLVPDHVPEIVRAGN